MGTIPAFRFSVSVGFTCVASRYGFQISAKLPKSTLFNFSIKMGKAPLTINPPIECPKQCKVIRVWPPPELAVCWITSIISPAANEGRFEGIRNPKRVPGGQPQVDDFMAEKSFWEREILFGRVKPLTPCHLGKKNYCINRHIYIYIYIYI